MDAINRKYGFYRNYLTEIRLLGAVGRDRIDSIQQTLRAAPPKRFGDFEVIDFEDCQDRLPIVSETDRSSKDVLIFRFKPVQGTSSMRATIRPSGTEPKTKLYLEIGTPAV